MPPSCPQARPPGGDAGNYCLIDIAKCIFAAAGAGRRGRAAPGAEEAAAGAGRRGRAAPGAGGAAAGAKKRATANPPGNSL